MPTAAAEAREREVVHIVKDGLRSRSSRQVKAEIVGWPECGKDGGQWPDDLTTDAVIRVTDLHGSVDWASDVVTLTEHPRLVPAIEDVGPWLRTELEKLSARYQRRIVVSFRPPVHQKDRGRSYRKAIVEYVNGLLAGTSTEDPFETDDYTDVEIHDGQAHEDGPGVCLIYTSTLTPVVRDQLDTTLLPPLRKKLERQLRRAHDLGYPTILIVDTAGPSGRFPHRYNFDNSDITDISQVVLGAVGDHDPLDFCVLVRPDDTCTPLYGDWPQGPSR